MSKNLTYEFVKTQIENISHIDSKLLSEIYINSSEKLDVICEHGHKFYISWGSISQGQWCPKCKAINTGNRCRNSWYNIKEKINESHPNCEILSTEKDYKDAFTKLDIICEHGHKFKIKWNAICRGDWCPKCKAINTGNRLRIPWKEIYKRIIELHPNCEILSTEKDYKDKSSKIKIKCESGHITNTMCWNGIRNGHWCSICKGINFSNRKKLSWNVVKDRIIELHPKCEIITTEKDYKNANSKLDIICEHGHKFKISFININQNHWCINCRNLEVGNRFRLLWSEVYNKIKKMHSNCEILSTEKEYKNSKTKLDIICEHGHKFKMCWSDIYQGVWCPYCYNKTEQKCREIFEKLTNKKFHSTYSVLKIPKKYNIKRLQLDGYNKELNLAFEYNGIQHYEATSHFGGKKAFNKRINHDRIKIELCKKQGIKLIVIPYRIKDLETYIKNKLNHI